MNLQTEIRAFAIARGWLKFHTPKNLAMAIASEVGELCHILRWDQPGEEFLFPPPGIEDETADILIFAIRLMDELGLDYEDAIRNKMLKNSEKYPSKETP